MSAASSSSVSSDGTVRVVPVQGALFPTFEFRGYGSVGGADELQESLRATVLDPASSSLSVSVLTEKTDDGYLVVLRPQGGIRPGAHHVTLALPDSGVVGRIASFFTGGDAPLFEGSVPLGGVALNAGKDLYVAGETALLTWSAVDGEGMPSCGAQSSVEVLDPSGTTTWYLGAADGIVTAPCADDLPEYSLSLPLPVAGDYAVAVRVTAGTEQRLLRATVRVSAGPTRLAVKRTMPDRIDAGATETVHLKLAPSASFVGTVTDTVPGMFAVTSADAGVEINQVGTDREIRWTGLWEAGKVYELTYDITAPADQPSLLTFVGPLRAAGTAERQVILPVPATEGSSASMSSSSAAAPEDTVSEDAGAAASTAVSSQASGVGDSVTASSEASADTAPASASTDSSVSESSLPPSASSDASESSVEGEGDSAGGDTLSFLSSLLRSVVRPFASLLGQVPDTETPASSAAPADNDAGGSLESSSSAGDIAIESSASSAADAGAAPASSDAPRGLASSASSASSESSDASAIVITETTEVRVTEERQWLLLLTPEAVADRNGDAVLPVVTDTPLTLTPAKDQFEARESAVFTLLDVDLPVADGERLSETTALTAIVSATTDDAALEQAVVESIVNEHAGMLAEKTLEDSVQVNTLRGVLGDDAGSVRRNDILYEAVTEAVETSDETKEILTQTVLQEGDIGAMVTDAIDDGERQEIIEAAVTGTDIVDAVRGALDTSLTAVTDAVSDSITESVREDADVKEAITDAVRDHVAQEQAVADAPVIRVTLTGANGQIFSPGYHFRKGSVQLVLEPERQFAPGMYTLTVEITNPLTGQSQTLTQDFAWGVLAMNADQDRYRPGDRAHVSIGVLDDMGDVVCTAQVALTVTDPDGKTQVFSIDDDTIAPTQNCGHKESMFIEPDYEAFFTVEKAGVYVLSLTAVTANGERSMESELLVTPSPAFVVTRFAATRLWPYGPSPVTLQVQFSQPYSGVIRDQVPDSFVITDLSGEGEISSASGGTVAIDWSGNWEAGDTATFTYVYDAPDVSPQFYLLGPLATVSGDAVQQVELRSWQIASDEVKTWDGGGATDNWDDCDNWSGNTCPTSSDIATFDTTSTDNAIINVAIDVAGIDINAGYSGTITQNAAVTVGSSGWQQATGTFTGGSQAITINAPFTQTGGTFTATTGTMRVGREHDTGETIFSQGGGTWSHNGGTLVFRPLGGVGCSTKTFTVDVPTTLTFNNVEVNGVVNCSQDIFANVLVLTGTGDTIVVAGALTQTDGRIWGDWQVKGNLIIGSGADGGESDAWGTVTLSGTGAQTYAYTSGGIGSAIVIDKPSGAVTAAEGTTDLRLIKFNLSGGSFTAPSGTFQLGRNYYNTQSQDSFTVRSGTTFAHNSGTLLLQNTNETCSQTIHTVDVPGTLRLYNVTVNGMVSSCNNPEVSTGAGDNVIVESTFALVDGYVSGSWHALGNVRVGPLFDGGTADGSGGSGNGVLTLTGSVATQIIESEGGAWPFATVKVLKSSGTATLSGSLALSDTGQDLVVGSGTLSLNSYGLTVNDRLVLHDGATFSLNGSETVSYGSHTVATGSTVRFLGDGDGNADTYTITDYFSGDFGKLTLIAADSSDTFVLGSALAVSGTLRQDSGTLDVSAGNYPISLSGSWLRIGGSFTPRRGDVILDGASQDAQISVFNGSLSLYNLIAEGAGGIRTLSDGTATVGFGLSVTGGRLAVGTGAELTMTGTGTTVTIGASGTLTNSGTLTVGGAGSPVSNSGTWRNDETSIVILTGRTDDTAVTVPAVRYGDFRINNDSTTFNLASAFSASGAVTLTAGTLDVTASNYPVVVERGWTDTASGDQFTPRSGSVIFTGTGSVNANEAFSGVIIRAPNRTVSLGASLLATGNVTVESGIFSAVASGNTITLSGAWLNAGTFRNGSGTVILDGGNQTMSGSTTFWNLSKTGSTTATLTAAAGATQTVRNTLSLKGSSGNPLSLRSSQTGNQWRINPQGTRALAYLDVQDSHNLNATVVSCVSNCTNSLNNTNWSFPWSGTVYTDEGITPIGANKTVAVSINGAAPVTADTDSSGNFVISNDPADGDVVAIYLDGETEKAAIVTRTDAATLGGMDLYQNRLILRNETGSTLTTAHLSTAYNVADSDLSTLYGVAGDSFSTSSSETEVYIRAGSTFTPSGVMVMSGDLDINGTLTLGSNTLVAYGTFDATGGSFTTSGTVTFASTLLESIVSNGSRFQNLSFNGIGGRWQLGDSLSVSGALTISNGTLDLAGQNLANRGGTFSNNATLRLNGSETLSNFTNDPDSGTTVFVGGGSYTGLAGITSFRNLAFSGAGTWTLNSAITASGALTLSGGTLDVSASNYGITVRGNWTDRRPATFVERRGTVTFGATGTITSNETFSGVLINAPAGTVSLGSGLLLGGNLTISGGTLAATSGNYPVTLSGTWLKKSGATFSAGSGSVTLDSGSHQTLSGSTTFWNLSKSVTAASTLTFAAGTTQTVGGTWTAAGASSNLLSLRSSQSGSQWRIDPKRTRTLSFVDVKDSYNTNASAVLCSSDCTNSGNNTNWAFPISVTVYTNSGTTLAGAGITVAVSVNGGTKSTADTNASGVASFTTVGTSPGDVLTIWLDDETSDGASVTVTNATSLDFVLYKDYLIVRHEYGSSITNANLAVADNVSDTDLDAIYTMSGTQLVMADGKTLRVWAGSTYAPGGKVTVDDIEIRGTFAMGTNAVTVSGSWDATSGTFTGTNTVTFLSGEGSVITSNGNSFNNVVFRIDNDDSAQWTTTDPINVTGTQTVESVAGTQDTTDPVISSVSAQLVSDSGALIVWTTDESANSTVNYGTSSGSLTLQATQSTYNLSHAVVLSGLTASQQYFYRVVSQDIAGNDATSLQYTFTTRASTSSSSSSSAASSAEAGTSGGGGGGGGGRGSSRDECSAGRKFADLLIENVVVTPHDDGTATVTWTMNSNAVGIANYGVESIKEYSTNNLVEFRKNHSLTLRRLLSQTKYKLQVTGIDSCGALANSKEITFISGKSELAEQIKSVLSDLAPGGTNAENIDLLTKLIDRYTELMSRFENLITLKDYKEGLVKQALSIRELASLLPGPALGGEPKVVVTDTAATVTWTTDEDASSLVSFSPEAQYVEGGNYQQTSGDPLSRTKEHSVALNGLKPGMLYHFIVKSVTPIGTQAVSRDFTFRTSNTTGGIGGYTVEILSPESARFNWTSNVATTTAVTYTPYRGDTLAPDLARTVNGADFTEKHSIVVKGFESGTYYSVELWGKDGNGAIVSRVINRFSTSDKDVPPVIESVRTDTAIVPGKDSRVQAVITWITNENTTGRVRYQKGIAASFEGGESMDAAGYARHHVVVLPALEPGIVYSFQVETADGSQNTVRSQTYTVLTPKEQESIFQVIIRQMEETFGWVNNLR